MIEFEITNSEDKELIGPNVFYKNQIFIGPKAKDVFIPLDNLKASASIDVFPTHIAITPNHELDYFLLNGKRSSTTRKINIGDNITIGENEIKIVNAEYQAYQLKKDVLTENLKNIIDNNPKKLEVIKTLESKIREL